MFLCELIIIKHKIKNFFFVIITGDLNFHLDDVNERDELRFMNSLDAHWLVLVGATHKMDHTLDVVITRDVSSLFIGAPTFSQPSLGDSKSNPSGNHLAEYVRVVLTKSENIRQQVTFRNLRDICIEEVIKDVAQILNNTDNSLDELIHAYPTIIELFVDQHAPLQRKLATPMPNTQ